MSVPLAVVEKVFVMGSLLNEIGVSAVALFPCVLQVRPAINGSGDARWLSIRSRAGGVIEAGGDGDSTEEDIEEGLQGEPRISTLSKSWRQENE